MVYAEGNLRGCASPNDTSFPVTAVTGAWKLLQSIVPQTMHKSIALYCTGLNSRISNIVSTPFAGPQEPKTPEEDDLQGLLNDFRDLLEARLPPNSAGACLWRFIFLSTADPSHGVSFDVNADLRGVA